MSDALTTYATKLDQWIAEQWYAGMSLIQMAHIFVATSTGGPVPTAPPEDPAPGEPIWTVFAELARRVHAQRLPARDHIRCVIAEPQDQPQGV
jgi:hypothetical protein